MTVLGKIVKSNSHTDYVCQIFGPGEVANPPQITDYTFGTFVRIAMKTQPDSCLIGLIYDTVLLNPEFGRLGPRLSPPSDLAVFSPDYLNEKVTLVGIQTIGMMEANQLAIQGFPVRAAQSDASVECMTEQQICDFHMGSSSWRYAYLPLLMAKPSVEARILAQCVLTQLKGLNNDPVLKRKLDLLADDLEWQIQIGPLGGKR